MGYSHHYDLVKEVGDTKDEPQYVGGPRPITSWRKFLLCNLLAAGIGAGAMFLVMRGTTSTIQPTSSVADSVITSPTVSVALALATPSAESANSTEIAARPILDCGYSPEEARARGCIFDVMMQDWVPEPCYDSVLTERYLAAGNWTWYADGDGTTTMSDEEMRKGEHGNAWMSTSYHKAHCVFSWLKIIRALRNRRGISQELLSYDHVLHCSHGALKADSNDESLGVSAPTNYAKCAMYETWIQDLLPDQHDSTE